MNAKKVIEKFAEEYGEIKAISIGNFGNEWEIKKPRFFNSNEINKALEILDLEFSEDFGDYEGYDIYVWFKDWIILKESYDGRTDYIAIPRNPNKEIIPDSIVG